MLQTDSQTDLHPENENAGGFLGLGEAVELGKLLSAANGGDVVVMDMRNLNFWTDFFVIATVTSSVHLSGMERHVKEYARERDLDILHRSRRPETEDEWCLLDMGGIVVHLMTAKTRAFYELERLWSAASIVYSSKSS
jgi:ribosome-associated protein